MIIHEHRHVTKLSNNSLYRHTLVMVESVNDDVAVYWHEGHVSAECAAAHGVKQTERMARRDGFSIPEGKHYRR